MEMRFRSRREDVIFSIARAIFRGVACFYGDAINNSWCKHDINEIEKDLGVRIFHILQLGREGF